MSLTSRRTVMARKRYKPEEIVAKWRQVDVLVSEGQNMVDAIRQIGVSEVTYYRWRQEFGGLKIELAKLSLRRESAIVESKPVGHGVLLVVVPCQLFLASRPEHDRTIPLAEVNSSYIARGNPFAKLRSR
jgi:hypothetical protein